MNKLKLFIQGFGSVFNLFPDIPPKTDFNISTMTDEEAIRSDWEAIGKDMQTVMDQFSKHLPQPPKAEDA